MEMGLTAEETATGIKLFPPIPERVFYVGLV